MRLVMVVMFSLVTACGMTHPGTHQLANDLATKLKTQVCQVAFRPGDPCGNRNVQTEGKSGIAVYVYIYGVDDKMEMQSLVNMAFRLREIRDRRIPVYITFYSDLSKSREINTIKIRGN